MSKQFNVAMVGLGFGAEFLPIYKAHPLGNVQALCQRNADKLNKIADQFGVAPATPSTRMCWPTRRSTSCTSTRQFPTMPG